MKKRSLHIYSLYQNILLASSSLRMKSFTNRRKAFVWCIFCGAVFVGLFLLRSSLGENGLDIHLTERKLPPSFTYLFGTDWLGRDMLTRTIHGLCRSLGIGLLAALCSSIISVILGCIAATFGKKVDYLISLFIDIFMSTPHLVLLILISFALGGGAKGVVIAVAISHWPRLARIIRAEVLQICEAHFIQHAQKFGKSSSWIIIHHIAPHLIPQFLVGLILMFPHAILHAAGLTFLGFGLSPHQPSIGIMLSESMRHLSTGYWWLAVIPGVVLVCIVKLFDILGNNLRTLCDPKTTQL